VYGPEEFGLCFLQANRKHAAQNGQQKKSEAMDGKIMEHHVEAEQGRGVLQGKAAGNTVIFQHQKSAVKQGADRGKKQSAAMEKHEGAHDDGEKVQDKKNRLAAAGEIDEKGHQDAVHKDLQIAETAVALNPAQHQGRGNGQKIEAGDEIGYEVQGRQEKLSFLGLEKDAAAQHQGEEKYPEKQQPLDLVFQVVVGRGRACGGAEDVQHGDIPAQMSFMASQIVLLGFVAQGAEAHLQEISGPHL